MAFLGTAISFSEHDPVAELFGWGFRFLCEATWPSSTGERESVPLTSSFPGSRVFPDKDNMLNAAFALAAEISSKSPVAVQGSKINLIYSRDHSVDESLDYMVRLNYTNHGPTWGSACVHTSDWCPAGLSDAPDPGHLEHEHAADPGHNQVRPGSHGEEGHQKCHLLQALSAFLILREEGSVEGQCLLPCGRPLYKLTT